MRTTLQIPDHLIRDATLYAPSRDPLDAVTYVLSDYPRVIAESRKMRSRLADIDRETADFDQRLEALQDACAAILNL
ncbi:hypothetical protein FBY04_109138 [Pseudomonas sp. SJZ080]|uniref:hypothetical protein n=1 Tax=Pseudomonas sp. SJZ080 TaxID=2572888 RepID=UPI00119BB0FF|nr:hypothetical protein [Pseudomonas sp. SJZ080]TWC55717.1 hypothetical protein FBY04_109138 [Pseudomonas sp. SJZ080]